MNAQGAAGCRPVPDATGCQAERARTPIHGAEARFAKFDDRKSSTSDAVRASEEPPPGWSASRKATGPVSPAVIPSRVAVSKIAASLTPVVDGRRVVRAVHRAPVAAGVLDLHHAVRALRVLLDHPVAQAGQGRLVGTLAHDEEGVGTPDRPLFRTHADSLPRTFPRARPGPAHGTHPVTGSGSSHRPSSRHTLEAAERDLSAAAGLNALPI